MKKVVAAVALALAAAGAQAWDVGVTGGVDMVNSNEAAWGVQLGTPVTLPFLGAARGALELSTTTSGAVYNQYALTLSKDVIRFKDVLNTGVNVRAGYAAFDPKGQASGGAFLMGAGVTVPMTKELSAVGTIDYRLGQDRVSAYDGWVGMLGVRYAF